MTQGAKWKNITSRKLSGDQQPTTWALDVDGVRIIVTRLHEKPGWWGRTNGRMETGTFPLEARDIDSAKKEWLRRVVGTHAALTAALEQACRDTGVRLTS